MIQGSHLGTEREARARRQAQENQNRQQAAEEEPKTEEAARTIACDSGSSVGGGSSTHSETSILPLHEPGAVLGLSDSSMSWACGLDAPMISRGANILFSPQRQRGMPLLYYHRAAGYSLLSFSFSGVPWFPLAQRSRRRCGKANLRFDSKEGAFRLRKGKAVIVPGNSTASALIRRISAEDEEGWSDR
jgi:hypothetical protein